MKKYRSADTDLRNCHVRKIYQMIRANRSKNWKKITWSELVRGASESENPGWKCVLKHPYADHRNAAVTVHRFVTWRNCHHGVDLMWDGVGKMAVDAILTQRLSGDTGVCGLMAIIYVMVNLVTDIIYHYLDPRIRLQENSGENRDDNMRTKKTKIKFIILLILVGILLLPGGFWQKHLTPYDPYEQGTGKCAGKTIGTAFV